MPSKTYVKDFLNHNISYRAFSESPQGNIFSIVQAARYFLCEIYQLGKIFNVLSFSQTMFMILFHALLSK